MSPRQREGAELAARLHHRTFGQKRDTALLLIHPLGADLRFWEDCCETWQKDFFCIACDLIGAGRSEIPDLPPSLDDHVQTLAALLDEMSVRRVVPIGCAIGAMVAATFAVRHPERTSALVLTNPGTKITPEAEQMLRRRVELVRQSGMEALLPDAVDRAFHRMPRDIRYARYLERFRRQDPEGYARSILGILGADISAELAAITCPILIVAGAHDLLMKPEDGAKIAQSLPSAEFVRMEDAAHFLPYQTPEPFAGLVSRFLVDHPVAR